VSSGERYPYTLLVGARLFLSTTTGPGITHAVATLTRHMAAPTASHWEAVKRDLSECDSA
jgi:hypothetical protein